MDRDGSHPVRLTTAPSSDRSGSPTAPGLVAGAGWIAFTRDLTTPASATCGSSRAAGARRACSRECRRRLGPAAATAAVLPPAPADPSAPAVGSGAQASASASVRRKPRLPLRHRQSRRSPQGRRERRPSAAGCSWSSSSTASTARRRRPRRVFTARRRDRPGDESRHHPGERETCCPGPASGPTDRQRRSCRRCTAGHRRPGPRARSIASASRRPASSRRRSRRRRSDRPGRRGERLVTRDRRLEAHREGAQRIPCRRSRHRPARVVPGRHRSRGRRRHRRRARDDDLAPAGRWPRRIGAARAIQQRVRGGGAGPVGAGPEERKDPLLSELPRPCVVSRWPDDRSRDAGLPVGESATGLHGWLPAAGLHRQPAERGRRERRADGAG